MSARFWEAESYKRAIAEALQILGVEKLVLAIHDSSFPSTSEEELGRGTPYGVGGNEFLRFIRDLGFTGVQLGPQGLTTANNPSPYDGTLFSRNILSLALGPLAKAEWGALITKKELADLTRDRPADSGPLAYRYALFAIDRALCRAATRFATSESPKKLLYKAFCNSTAFWLESEALFHAAACANGTDDWTGWSELDQQLLHPKPGFEIACAERISQLQNLHAREMNEFRFAQFVAHEQHRELQEKSLKLGLKLYGDLQVGCSHRDRWRFQPLFLRDYAMGAPPSRTTTEGQAWGFPVLDPDQYGEANAPGPAMEFVRARMAKALDEFDGVRIDHPHGFVCPWVYNAHAADALAAVTTGARLFDSPDLPDHPALAAYAIARPEQLDRSRPRYDDQWVRSLEPAQIDRYAKLFDAMMNSVVEAGRSLDDVQCEVLSTWPNPLWEVMQRYGLGRMRVTQKASLLDRFDVYRSENAQPNDWVMTGNHDTPSLWSLLDRWRSANIVAARATYLSERLIIDEPKRAAFATALEGSRGALAEAMFADLFASQARHVSIFFADLLGLEGRYNLAGSVDPNNWMLRVPTNYSDRYTQAVAAGRALHFPRVLALALRARGITPSPLLSALAVTP